MVVLFINSPDKNYDSYISGKFTEMMVPTLCMKRLAYQ